MKREPNCGTCYKVVNKRVGHYRDPYMETTITVNRLGMCYTMWMSALASDVLVTITAPGEDGPHRHQVCRTPNVEEAAGVFETLTGARPEKWVRWDAERYMEDPMGNPGDYY